MVAVAVEDHVGGETEVHGGGLHALSIKGLQFYGVLRVGAEDTGQS